MLWIKIEVTDFFIQLSLKFEAVQKCQHCQFCVLGETRMMTHHVTHVRQSNIESLTIKHHPSGHKFIRVPFKNKSCCFCFYFGFHSLIFDGKIANALKKDLRY